MKDYKYLLLFQWLLINLVGFFLLGLTGVYGGVNLVLVADQTYISVLIFGVFLWGFVLSGIKVFQTSRELNFARDINKKSRWENVIAGLNNDRIGHTKTIEILKIKMFEQTIWIKWIANSLVLLGLVGTVVGFIIALSGINPSLVTDVSVIAKVVSTLISGMGTALYTTLVGAVFNLWLSANYLLLSSGIAKLLALVLRSKVVDETIMAEANSENV